jgi:hypothetical protein
MNNIYAWIFRFLFDPDQWVARKWLRQFVTFAAMCFLDHHRVMIRS